MGSKVKATFALFVAPTPATHRGGASEMFERPNLWHTFNERPIRDCGPVKT